MDNSLILKKLEYLEKLETQHSEICRQMLEANNGNIFAVDLLAKAVLNRSMCIISGFTHLVSLANYICAVPILRLQIDNLLRFYATHLVTDPENFVKQYLDGTHIRDLKDREGKRLCDGYLKEKLGQIHTWLPTVYNKASGFVHLSNTHAFLTINNVEDKKREISFNIGSKNKDIPVVYWIELIDCFTIITKILLFDYIEGWVSTKEKKE